MNSLQLRRGTLKVVQSGGKNIEIAVLRRDTGLEVRICLHAR